MVAVLLSLALFSFWLALGLGVVLLLGSRRNVLQCLLLAPGVGVGTLVLPLAWLSWLGLPVVSIALPLTALLTLATAGLVWSSLRSLRRGATRAAVRAWLPFGALLPVALLVTGWPMIEFGFAWLSYSNPDMANYVLDAHRIATYGMYQAPSVETLAEGRDYSQLYWFFAVAGVRPGSQLLLAWVISLTGRSGHEIFMPTIVALHLVLIGAAGGLVCQSRRLRPAALLTMLLLSVSPLTSLGTLNQLIGQVYGLGLLATISAVVLRPIERERFGLMIRRGVLGGVLGSALLIVYPEAIPFLGVACVLLLGCGMVQTRTIPPWRRVGAMWGIPAVCCVMFTTTYLAAAVQFMLVQLVYAGKTSSLLTPSQLIFPYYLVPSGFANLWGLQAISSLMFEPWASLSIVAGIALSVLACFAGALAVWRGAPVATMMMAMVLTSIELYAQQSDFGLYKLAMFVQPFMLGSLALLLAGAIGRRRQAPHAIMLARWSRVGDPGGHLDRKRPMVRTATGALVSALLVIGLSTQQVYVNASRGYSSTHVMLPGASSANLVGQFIRILEPVAATHDAQIMLSTPESSLAMIQAVYVRGMQANYASRYFFTNISLLQVQPLLDAESRKSLIDVLSRLHDRVIEADFPWFAADDRPSSDVPPIDGDPEAFTINELGELDTSARECDFIVGQNASQSRLNGWTAGDSTGRYFFLSPCDRVEDYLVFVDAAIARNYDAGLVRSEVVARGQLESDPLFPSESFVSYGRRMLFRVVSPSMQSHLVMSMTASLKGDGENRLPPAVAIGAVRSRLPIVGRGSARVFSDAVSPVRIANRSFLGIDMGVDGQRFPEQRSGAMRWFGTDVALDRRLITVFGRDVSLISDRAMARLAPPTAVMGFPQALTDRNLEYSGVYEDGWISEASFFGLAQPAGPSTVAVKGSVPLIDDPNFSTELRLLVDGQEVTRQTLRPGPFELRGPAPPGGGRRRVELQFSEFQRLGGNDRRPVAAFMSFIGFESLSDVALPSALHTFPLDPNDPSLKASGLAVDGWIGSRSSVALSQPAEADVIAVRGTVPLLDDPRFTTELRLFVDGQDVASKTVGPGDFELRAPIPPSSRPRQVELRASATQTLPAPDGRQVGARVAFLGFERATLPAPAGAAAPPIAPSPVPIGAAPAAASATVVAAAQATPAVPTGSSPTAVKEIPTDLRQPGLNPTGIQDDGWVAGVASVELTQPNLSSPLIVRGMVPLIGDPAFTTELRLLVDGQEAARRTLGLGDFELISSASIGIGTHHVELHFTSTQQLPAPDTRAAAARLSFVGFEAARPVPAATSAAGARPTISPPPAILADPATDVANPAFAVVGLDTDGWTTATLSLQLGQAAGASTLVVRGMVPLVDDPAYTSDVDVSIDGQVVGHQQVGLGDFELRVPAPPGPATRRVELRFSSTQQLPAPDTRRVGARISSIGF